MTGVVLVRAVSGMSGRSSGALTTRPRAQSSWVNDEEAAASTQSRLGALGCVP